MNAERGRSENLPDVREGQVWADNDWRSGGRLVLVIRVPSLDVPNPSEIPVLVETVRSRDNATGYEDSKARGRRHCIKLRRFRPNSTGYRLTDLTSEDVS